MEALGRCRGGGVSLEHTPGPPPSDQTSDVIFFAVPHVRLGYTMSCGCTQSARKVWMLSFLLIASQVPGLLSVPAAMYTRRSAHVAVPQPAAKCSFAGGCGWSAHHQGTCSHLGVRRRRSQAWESRVHWCGKVRMNVGDEGESRRAGGGPRPKKRPLGLLSTGVNDAILEMCVENKGRPLARALTDFVEYTIEALASGEGLAWRHIRFLCKKQYTPPVARRLINCHGMIEGTAFCGLQRSA